MSEEPPVHASSPVVTPQIIETRVKVKGTGWKWFWIALIVCFLGGCATLLLVMGELGRSLRYVFEDGMETSSGNHTYYDASSDFMEVVLRWDKEEETSNKILLIDVSGVIYDTGSRYASKMSISPGLIENQLKKAGKDSKVRAVILRVDSPGGEAFACDLIAAQIQKFHKTYNKPVVAWINSMGASGGYYVSAPCQWVIAHEMSVVGSIGVISSSYNYRELLDKVGVKPMV